jgi:hypothetical protein
MTAGCDNFKTSSLTIGMQLVQITRFIASRIAEYRFQAGSFSDVMKNDIFD